MGVFCRQGSIRMYSMTKSALFSEATALSGCQKDTWIAGACCVLPRNPTLHVRHRRSLRIFSKDTHCAMHALHPPTPTGRWRCRIPSMGKRAGGRHISLVFRLGPSLWMGRGHASSHASGRINPKLIIWTEELRKGAAGAVDSHIQNSVMLVFFHIETQPNEFICGNPICPVFHKKSLLKNLLENLCQAFGLSSFSALLVIVNVSRSKKLKTWVLRMKRSVDRQFCSLFFKTFHEMSPTRHVYKVSGQSTASPSTPTPHLLHPIPKMESINSHKPQNFKKWVAFFIGCLHGACFFLFGNPA